MESYFYATKDYDNVLKKKQFFLKNRSYKIVEETKSYFLLQAEEDQLYRVHKRFLAEGVYSDFLNLHQVTPQPEL